MMPNALAVFILITVSNFVGACTGKSDAFSPFNTRSISTRAAKIARLEQVNSGAAALTRNLRDHSFVARILAALYGNNLG